MHPHYDMSYYDGDLNFDLEADFLQFLDEARRGKTDANRSVSFPYTEMGAKRVSSEDKKSKFWRNSLFSWLKVEKKGKAKIEPATNKNRSYLPKRGHVSGPIGGGSSNKEFDAHLLRRMNSASLASLFSPHKRVESEVHYLSLEESSYGVKNYGPVYLVT